MKLKYIFITVLSLFFLSTCNNEKESSSEAHRQAVEITRSMDALHKSLKKQLSELEEENMKLTNNVRSMEEPDAVIMQMIKAHNSVITKLTGRLKSQEELIKQHQTYINKHETSALSPTEIKAQHIQMNKDFEMLKQEVLSMSKEMEDMKQQYH